MRAVTCTEAQLAVADVPELVPEAGQVVLEVLRCGICGSDLHARHHCDELAEVIAEVGLRRLHALAIRASCSVTSSRARSASTGRAAAGSSPTGTPVVALPLMRRAGAPQATGLSAAAPGAYAEQVLVQESLMMAVPNGLSPELARAHRADGDRLACRAPERDQKARRGDRDRLRTDRARRHLHAQGPGRRRRSSPATSRPARRALATACGADVVVDPARLALRGGRHGHLTTMPEVVELAIWTVEKLRRLPVAWQHVWRADRRAGDQAQAPGRCSSAWACPAMIDAIIAGAPLFSRVVVVGVCMGADTIRPSMAINKEIDLRFVLGYTPLEFRDTLQLLAEGKVERGAAGHRAGRARGRRRRVRGARQPRASTPRS